MSKTPKDRSGDLSRVAMIGKIGPAFGRGPYTESGTYSTIYPSEGRLDVRKSGQAVIDSGALGHEPGVETIELLDYKDPKTGRVAGQNVMTDPWTSDAHAARRAAKKGKK